MAARRRVKLTPRFYTLLLLAMVILLVVRLAQGFVTQRSLEREIERKERALEATRAEIERLEDEVAEMQSDSYVERRAREDLGLVMPGEERYQVIPVE